jgi:hypothetical protein
MNGTVLSSKIVKHSNSSSSNSSTVVKKYIVFLAYFYLFKEYWLIVPKLYFMTRIIISSLRVEHEVQNCV